MGEKKEWLKDEIDDLINLYQGKPELWDVKSNVYRDRVKKRNALVEIATKFDITVEEATRKIHNLRNQFNSEFKKCLKKKSGQGTDEYISKWRYFGSLSFLQRGSVCKLADENKATDGVMNEVANETITVQQDVSLDQSDEYDAPEEAEPISENSRINTGKKRKRLLPKDKRLMKKAIIRALDEEEDQYDIFGKYVASELRNCSSDYLRKKMKRKLQEVVLEINKEEEQLLNPLHAETENQYN